ncbi:hypothetical protein H257_17112 [Aphanomyces astaci]|uniref:CCHC-type domain-containing protein n=1 Tax=Aphanomyces astaci TaxID=112090 RepID=W4FHV4_APHAT|nr:hypothetical protein H257_17112 [Aphanomyces astaci]ETV66444.1 hypothetical protein H257_17112 [Aphanomyces astaci]|eukprot:XP_009844078.1 hypothetical protein H257_17112 [Aphanomyces astaci]
MEEAFVRMMGAMEQQQKMINQLLEAQAQTHTQMMRDQQAHQEQQLLLHQQLQDAMNQLANQQPVEQQRDTERRVEGLSMPAYHGHLNESIGLYIHRVKTFFMAKNLNYEQNEVVEARCLAMVVANLQGQAAAWYQELASRRVNGGFRTLVDFEQALPRKKDRSKLRCFNCQGFGHFAAACQKPKKKISGDGPPGKQNNLEVEEAPSDQDVEYITFGAMEENGAEGVAVSKAQVGRSQESGRAPLMIKSGIINGKVVNILIDSGATNSLCRVGLGKNVIRSKAVRISGYDGLMSPLTETRELKETVQIGTFTFHDTQLTEWDLKDKAFDVILGQPWFKKHNPVIDWRKHDGWSVHLQWGGSIPRISEYI